jgi:hypothetical protein
MSRQYQWAVFYGTHWAGTPGHPKAKWKDGQRQNWGAAEGEARLSAREMKADPKRFRNVVLKRRPVGDWEPVEL